MAKAPSVLAAIGGTAASKVLVMGLSGVLGIITSRLIIQHFGTAAYAQYGLLTSFPSLLPFADLGIAAVIINVIASSNSVRDDPEVHRTLVTALRVLSIASGVIVAAAIVITAAGWWPALLGNGLRPNASLAAGLCLAIFGLVLPLTAAQRAAVGLRRTRTQVLAQAVVAPFMLLSIGAVILFSGPLADYLGVFSYLGNALVSVICLIVVVRAMSPQWGRAVRDIPRVRSVPGIAILKWTWPVLIQMIALPVAMQMGRLLLSHLTTGPELAQYNLASQLFGIIVQTISAAGVALWPIYAKARADSRIEAPYRATLLFLGGGLILGALLVVVSPFLTQIVSGGKIALPLPLLLSFLLFVGVQATKYPLGMYMTDQRGLIFQVWPILVMVPLTLGLSVLFIGFWGAAGPVLATALSVGLCQVLPNLLFVRWDLRRRRAHPQSESDPRVDAEAAVETIILEREQ